MAKGLGKGHESLFEDNTTDILTTNQAFIYTNITKVEPNKAQPRKTFKREALEELAASITENGIIQPILVRPLKNGQYQIISGERRWRAARLAGLMEVPVIIKNLDDKTTLELALIENLQREDLNAVEEAKGYKALIEDFSLTQEQVAKSVGKSRPTISNAMRILALPEQVLELTLAGKLTSGHARALLPIYENSEDEEQFFKIVNDIIRKDLTVRDVEKMAKPLRPNKPPQQEKEDIYYKDLCEKLSKSWGRKIKIKSDKKTKGKKGAIILEYYNKEDFETLIERLNDKND